MESSSIFQNLLDEIKFLKQKTIEQARDIAPSIYRNFDDLDIEYIINYPRRLSNHFEISNNGINKVMVQYLTEDKEGFYYLFQNRKQL
jgi:hypothetical protein